MVKNVLKFMVITLIVLFVSLIIYFNISYSPMKNKFYRDLDNIARSNKWSEYKILREEDFKDYPQAIRFYIKNNGFLGKKAMNYMNINFKNIDFKQDKNKELLINYDQYNFAKEPVRLALIESSLALIPFEGYDSFIDGKGSMKGMIGKAITIFDQKGMEMDKANLATYLAECLFIPSSLLNNNISFEQIDTYKVKAKMEYKSMVVNGIFTFNEKYEMISFQTNDRAMVKDDGSFEYIPWIANCSDYEVTEQGINLPKTMQAVWRYKDYDLIYFDGKIDEFIYKYEK